MRQQLLLGRGMCSDDTEHACMTAQALLASGGDPAKFARSLSWRLRWWLLGLPAGVGFATLRSILKLWIGFPVDRSGVWSAGNGPVMRAAIIGLYAGHDRGKLVELVGASSRMTHRDPRATDGALVVAIAAYLGATSGTAAISLDSFLDAIREIAVNDELMMALTNMRSPLARSDSVAEYATANGLTTAVSGYVNHTVPVAIYAWLRHPNSVREAVESVVELGGDTDTTGAIVGALVGATAGTALVPIEWIDGICEWPRTTGWLRRLAVRLAKSDGRPLALFWPKVLARNVAFLTVVLLHGFRRLLPPF